MSLLCYSSHLAENVLAFPERSILTELVPMYTGKIFIKALSSYEYLI